LRIPKGKGDGAVAPLLGGTGAAVDDDVGVDDAEARDDEAVAPLAVMLSYDMPASTYVGDYGVLHGAAPHVLVANGGPSACRAGLVKSECQSCV